MLRFRKIIACIVLCIICILLTSKCAWAINISKEALDKNLNMYAAENKQAHAIKDGKMITVGGKNKKFIVTDNTITYVEDEMSIEMNYEITGNKIKFYSDTSFSKIPEELFAEDNNAFMQIYVPELLPICFLAVTDNYEIDSDLALQYYYDTIYKNTQSLDELLKMLEATNAMQTIPTQETLKLFISAYTNSLNKNISNELLQYSAQITETDSAYNQSISLTISTEYIHLLGDSLTGGSGNSGTPNPDNNANPENQPPVNSTVNNTETENDNTVSKYPLPNTGKLVYIVILGIIITLVVIGIVKVYNFKEIK